MVGDAGPELMRIFEGVELMPIRSSTVCNHMFRISTTSMTILWSNSLDLCQWAAPRLSQDRNDLTTLPLSENNEDLAISSMW